ncbi:hypothetical protein AACH06_03920 [Ideonella sp. DXS29W]|uniref:Uncharacterized protein n=1 Tax=Ideonella lacteola TaxID=2984193 RepID=A0ABU9BMV1_9BURK
MSKAAQTRDGAYYGGAVKLVNQQLQDSGFGMTEASRNSVVTNLRKVSSGKMLNMQAHSCPFTRGGDLRQGHEGQTSSR